ncbi:hypothetical protein Cri9333_0592 [Crinalium epipsammum PCC 9333]|uniref:WYL domain-containing protein n=1 Tax=Crinalium epipsammum PCC 9333 TaxID=1173022 RepID=K9VTY9_9CYAN|nr:TIGR03985 family CRISPR-associated protein [Crinalium epipsammum]AFZ11538.1 hypothetical protein Cri9333_0592 [Crinalium epipsammum PCC 9333]
MRTQFAYSPSVSFLQMLAPGSSKQNLPKAVRLWVILRSLYGSDNDEVKLNLREQFTYDEWRNQFFTSSDPLNKRSLDEVIYHKRDQVPLLHDPSCRCAKTLRQWLFDPNSSLSISPEKWKQSFLQIYPIDIAQLEEFLLTGKFPKSEEAIEKRRQQSNSLKASKNQLTGKQRNYVPPFPEGRLFAVTGKNLEYDFENLIKIGWLEAVKNKKNEVINKNYRKVKKFPILESYNWNSNISGFITQTDFTEIVENYFQPINGIQRFLMHVDYVVSKEAIDRIRELQDQLKEIWEKTPIPPISIIYESASLARQGKRIIYPVCIYYFQRAPYLCAFGQKPKIKNEIEWHNYRLDRIHEITELTWNDENLPVLLKEKYYQQQLSPEEIQTKMAESWGFDFYQPSHKLLLRFDRDFHDRHIIDSFRHETFTYINSKANFKKFIRDYAPNQEEEKLLNDILQSLPVQQTDENFPYAYYTADYRINDNNVIMRLRAWGQKVEVLLPGDLRQRMAKDIEETWQLYQS